MQRAAVIGAGSWGTAFAAVLAQNVEQVTLWSHNAGTAEAINTTHRSDRYLVDYDLPANLGATASYAEALEGAELVVLALPSSYLRATCHEIAALVPTSAKILVLTKGIEPKTGLLMSEVVAEELGGSERICALSGPNHAEEVIKGAYSAAVIAGEDIECSEVIRDCVHSPVFRVYVSDDPRGVEICGATKNVIAIACGICVGLGLGDNTLAVMMTRGIAEIGRMVNVIGGNPITCMGLAGMGDLVATCTSPHSRNRSFGEAFVAGTSLEAYEQERHMVVEGARACISVRELAHANGVEVPIVEAVYSLLYGDTTVEDVINVLTGRKPNEEFYGMDV